MEIVEKIKINTTGNFGRKGSKTYFYGLFENGKKIASYQFKTQKTKKEILEHYKNDIKYSLLPF